MSFDLCVWYSGTAVSEAEALATYHGLVQGDPGNVEESPALGAFTADLRREFPWLDDPHVEPDDITDGFELETSDWHVWFGIPWSNVVRVAPVIARLAAQHDLVLFDPQEPRVHLPRADGRSTPGAWSAAAKPGLDLLQAVALGLAEQEPTGDVQEDMLAHMRWLIEQHGVTIGSPTGVEVGPDNLEDLPELLRLPDVPFVEPFPTEPARQTPKALEAQQRLLASGSPAKRRSAVGRLGGWAPTEVVLGAVRSALGDDDVYVRGEAVHSLGHLGDEASLNEMLRVTGDLVACEPILDHGIDLAAEAAADAVHGLTLLQSAQEPDIRERLRELVSRLRPTGASFDDQVAWILERLET